MVSMPASHFHSLLCVHHKDKEGALHSLQGSAVSVMVLDAISKGERFVSTRFFSRWDLMRLKLESESQVNLVVEFPWNGRCLLKVVVEANDTQVHRQILAMAVDRIRKTASLNKILALKGLTTCTVRENPYLGPGHAPYENFIQSLLKITDTSTPAGLQLLDEADESTLISLEQRGLRTVFHAVIDAILKSGLDPNCRGPDPRCPDSVSTSDYFGIDYKTSLQYSTDSKLLVFLIIVKSTGSVALDGAVTVKSNKLQLPLAEVTLGETESWRTRIASFRKLVALRFRQLGAVFSAFLKLDFSLREKYTFVLGVLPKIW